MKVNFINLDIHSSGNLAMHIRQNSLDDLNNKQQMTRSNSIIQPRSLELSPSI